MASSSEVVDKYLVRRCINYHGERLLKSLQVSQLTGIESPHLCKVDYGIFRERFRVVRNHPPVGIKELHTFISKKGNNLFKTQPRVKTEHGLSEDDVVIKTEHGLSEDDVAIESLDQRTHLLPLEYYMKVDWNTRKNKFFESTRRGDILYGRVTGYVSNNFHEIVISFIGGANHRYLCNTDVKFV